MTIEVQELWAGRTETDTGHPTAPQRTGATVPYIVHGAATEADIITAVRDQTPPYYQSLIRKEIRIDEIIDSHEPLFSARVSVSYGQQAIKQPGESEFEFDTGGGTQRITQALATIAKYPSGASDHGGAIGFDGERVNGIDIPVPEYQFAETHYFAPSTVNDAFKLTVKNVTGKVNSDTFRGFPPGEVLFLGASGRQRGNEDWQITYRFSVKSNQTGLTIGDFTGISLNGWDIADIYYGLDTDADSIIKRPVSVVVRRVLERTAFSALGL